MTGSNAPQGLEAARLARVYAELYRGVWRSATSLSWNRVREAGSGEGAEVAAGLGFATFGVDMGAGTSRAVEVGPAQMMSAITF